MLKIHSNPRFDFPHSVRGTIQHKFALSPVIDEEDELITSIETQKSQALELVDRSGEELESFWDNVLSDVRQDPEWNNFAQDD